MFTILIVDDNATFRAQAARLAEREGFATVTAGDLAELTSALMQSTPDLVLVDIELPSIPGHRLGSLIRSRSEERRVGKACRSRGGAYRDKQKDDEIS